MGISEHRHFAPYTHSKIIYNNRLCILFFTGILIKLKGIRLVKRQKLIHPEFIAFAIHKFAMHLRFKPIRCKYRRF